jgi:starvation-inducible outer membrane lipoprotein
MTLKVKVMARAVEEGYPLGEQAVRSGGGTIQTMSRETATTLEGITLIMNEAADPATSTNYAIILGWSP